MSWLEPDLLELDKLGLDKSTCKMYEEVHTTGEHTISIKEDAKDPHPYEPVDNSKIELCFHTIALQKMEWDAASKKLTPAKGWEIPAKGKCTGEGWPDYMCLDGGETEEGWWMDK